MQLGRLLLEQLGQQRLSSNSRVVLSAQTRLGICSLQDSQHRQECGVGGVMEQPGERCLRMHAV
jgi:hypothetical protein